MREIEADPVYILRGAGRASAGTVPLYVQPAMDGGLPAAVGGWVEFSVLGPLQVSVAGRPVAVGTAPKRRLVLAVLARAGQPVPADTLVAAVWGARPPPPGATSSCTCTSSDAPWARDG